jgi:hypothetical protein
VAARTPRQRGGRLGRAADCDNGLAPSADMTDKERSLTLIKAAHANPITSAGRPGSHSGR